MENDAVFIEPFVDTGLGNSAYLVGSHATHTAVLIDPLRDVDRYLAAAEQHSVQVVRALDTHLHADFVSGARELAARAGAQIGASAEAKLGFEHQPLVEGDVITLGPLTLKVLATPGHTPEHISFLTQGQGAAAPTSLFSGGALIVGGAARTDLLGHDLTEPLARRLYHTLHHKLLKLPDAVDVYPTHGAGSFCAAPTSDERVTTIGRERQQNRLAQAGSESEFVEWALAGLPSYPAYYRELRAVNQRGPVVLGGAPILKPLSPEAAHAQRERGALVLDVRSAGAFARGHVPGSYGIQLDAPLGTWAGWLIPFNAPLILVAQSPAGCETAVRQLIRIGYDNLLGTLDGGMQAWAQAGMPVESVPAISVGALRGRMRRGEELVALDVRQDSEWEAGHIPGALHIENGRLPVDPLPFAPDQPVAVHCAHGARSMAGLSVLARRGFKNLLHVEGGFEAWKEAGFPVTRN